MSRSNWKFTQVAGPYGLTEGPIWDGEALLFTEVPGSRILRYDPCSNKTEVFREGTNNANGLMLDKNGRLYACEGGGRCIVRYGPNNERVVLAHQIEGKKFNSPNDLAIDPKGRIWFTDPHYKATNEGVYSTIVGEREINHESVYRLTVRHNHGWSIQRMTYDTTKPNGILISLDSKTLYVAQSEYGKDAACELRAYPILDDDRLGRHKVLHNFYPHRGIDGMCLDSGGNIVAVAGWERSGPGGLVYLFNPKGRVLETHPTPCSRPTNCSWGDEDLQTLYLTSYCGGLFRTRTPLKGSLFSP